MNVQHDILSNTKAEKDAFLATFARGLGEYIGEYFERRYKDACLTRPIVAFLLVWECENREFSRLEYIEDSFPGLLREKYERIGFANSVAARLIRARSDDDSRAVYSYLATLSMLLRAWRQERPLNEAYGSFAAHWCDQHPELFSRIKLALSKRSRSLNIQSGNWELFDRRPGGPADDPRNKHLVLKVEDLFGMETSWSKAGENLAYAIFGEFLLDNPEKIGFCARCEKPFERGRKKNYCSKKCAHVSSSYSSRYQKRALKRLRGLRSAANALKIWLRKKRKNTSDWREEVELAFGLSTDSGKKSKIFHEYIVAAETPEGSPQREKLLASLLTGSRLSPMERDKTHLALIEFLGDIKTAIDLTREPQTT